MQGYAALGIETSGVVGHGHRIVAIAIVQLTPAGSVEDVWTTRVGQGRPMTDRPACALPDPLAPPPFARIAADVIARLRDRVLVTHLPTFETWFLATAFAAAGIEVPDLNAIRVSTRELAASLQLTVPRTLAECCREAGLPVIEVHSALAEAEATALLFRHFQGMCGIPLDDPSAREHPVPWRTQQRAADKAVWSEPPAILACEPARLGRAERHAPTRLAPAVGGPVAGPDVSSLAPPVGVPVVPVSGPAVSSLESRATGRAAESAVPALAPPVGEPVKDPAAPSLGMSVTSAREHSSRVPQLLHTAIWRVTPLTDRAHRHYLSVLHYSLLDRHRAGRAHRSTADLARLYGIEDRDARRLHVRYLAAIVQGALSEAVLTKAEYCDLLAIADLLGLEDHLVNRAICLGIGARR